MIDKELLYQKFIVEDYSQDNVAEFFGCSRATVKHYLIKYKIEKQPKFKIEKSWLLTKYINEGLTQDQIAKIIGCNRKNISYFLNKYGIKKEIILQKKEKSTKLKTKIESKSIKQKKLKTIINNNIVSLNKDDFQNLDTNKIIENKFNLTPFKEKIINDTPNFKLTEKIYLNIDNLNLHSELFINRWHHFNLRKKYEDAGLRLIQIREDELNLEKINIIGSIINNALNKTEFKIGARKTNVKKVENIVASTFLKNNHVKGHKSAKHLGLYFNDELVSIMSYKLGRDKKNQSSFIKIERFCSKINYNIVGGFSKLLKAVEEDISEKYPIHYWVDLRYGTGNFLLNHGFKLEKETLGWEWTDFKTTYNRLKCRANMDDRKLTEKQHSNELGWYRIFDAGQRLYIK